MATSRSIDKQRKSYQRAKSKLDSTAKKARQAGEIGYAERLEKKSEQIQKTIDRSYVGRAGGSDSRQQRINEIDKLLSSNDNLLKEAKYSVSKAGSAQIRKDIAFTEARKMRQSKNVSYRNWKGTEVVNERPLTSAFYQTTQDLWVGAANPNDRNKLILEGLAERGYNVKNIGEAFSAIVGDTDSLEYDALMSRNWRSLARQGWSKEDIQRAKSYDAKGKLYDFARDRFNIKY